MKIGGYGELENVQKAVRKDNATRRAEADTAASSGAESSREDAVQISSQAKIMGKLQKVPDLRQEKIKDVLERADRGALMTPEAVKESIAQMLEGML